MADSKTELSPTTSKKVFEEINERPVDDIQLELFYKPHTITLRECLTIIESNPLLHLFARKSFFSLYSSVMHIWSYLHSLCTRLNS